MRIVHAFHNYYPVVGGMERVVQGLAEAQAKMGHEVHVVTSNCSNNAKQDFEVLNNVNVHRIPSYRLRLPDLTIPRSIPLELIKQADILHAHGHNSLFSQKVLLQANKSEVQTACYFMAVNAFDDHPNFLVRTFAPYYGKKSTQRAISASNIVLVKNLRDLKILKEDYHIEAAYLPDAVNGSILVHNKQNSAFFEKFKIKQKRFFLFIGRMHKLKGPHFVVEALKYIPDDTAAVFIGPDVGYLNKTMNLAKELGVNERAYFLGFIDEATKLAAIDSSIALILPSIADYVEVYPGVISEAWAREKAVIASNVGGIPYRIKDHFNGLLVEAANPKLLAASMLELINDEHFAIKLGLNGRSEVSSWEQIAAKSIELYTHASR
jgi:glycosyltransferase involved in cell wall biosynthesis